MITASVASTDPVVLLVRATLKRLRAGTLPRPTLTPAECAARAIRERSAGAEAVYYRHAAFVALGRLRRMAYLSHPAAADLLPAAVRAQVASLLRILPDRRAELRVDSYGTRVDALMDGCTVGTADFTDLDQVDDGRVVACAVLERLQRLVTQLGEAQVAALTGRGAL